MRLTSMTLCLVLSACAGAIGPDPRDEFTGRNIGQTVVTFVQELGTQAVHMAPDGGLYLWSSAKPDVQKGRWRYDVLATGSATSYQGAGGINYPVESLETAWGLCFQYLDETGQIIRRPEGGDWNCALLADYESLIIDRAPGDVFGLTRGGPVPAMPPGARLVGAQLQEL